MKAEYQENETDSEIIDLGPDLTEEVDNNDWDRALVQPAKRDGKGSELAETGCGCIGGAVFLFVIVIIIIAIIKWAFGVVF